MAAGRMTQKQLIRHLAERCSVNDKVARSFLDELAKMAVRETKKSGVFFVPGISRRIKANRKPRMGRMAAAKKEIVSAKVIPGKDPALETLSEVFSHL